MQTIQLVNQPIDPAKWAHCLHDIDTGSHLWFSGVTRRKTTDSSGQTTVTRTLHYEAYAEMAIEQLERLAKDARLRFELSGVVIIHRLGEVPLGEASVLVGCSSAHRKSSFEAVPWIMYRLKADVPIWKRETFEDSSTQWIHP